MPTLKTCHWAGVTLALKNLFGIVTGTVYGWPKNVLHSAGIHESIVDIQSTQGIALPTNPWPARWVLMLAFTYSMAAITAVRPPIDPDIWWHLRTGSWIVEHRALPVTDPFSAYGMGKPWFAYSWLFEVVLLALYKTLGLLGIIVYGALGAVCIALALHLVASRYQASVPRALALTTLSVGAMSPVFWPRSYLFSILLFIVAFHIVLSVRESGRPQPLLLLPPLFALWANLHIQFVYGLFVLGVAALEPIVERLLPKTLLVPRPRIDPRWLWGILLACAAASLATPYHIWIYRPLLEHVTHVGTFDLINELQAPKFRLPTDWIMLGMALAASFVLGRRRTLEVLPIVLLIAGAFVSFRAQRDVWFVAVVSLAIVAYAPRDDRAPRYRPTLRQLAMALLLSTFLVSGFAAYKGASSDALEASVRTVYPVAAAAIVEERRYRGPLFNHYDWGGYLIWRLPTFPVSIDGRANIYGPEKIKQSTSTWQGLQGWDADQELAQAGVVIASRKLALAELLRRDARFDLAYEDDVAAVFVPRR